MCKDTQWNISACVTHLLATPSWYHPRRGCHFELPLCFPANVWHCFTNPHITNWNKLKRVDQCLANITGNTKLYFIFNHNILYWVKQRCSVKETKYWTKEVFAFSRDCFDFQRNMYFLKNFFKIICNFICLMFTVSTIVQTKLGIPEINRKKLFTEKKARSVFQHFSIACQISYCFLEELYSLS